MDNLVLYIVLGVVFIIFLTIVAMAIRIVPQSNAYVVELVRLVCIS